MKLERKLDEPHRRRATCATHEVHHHCDVNRRWYNMAGVQVMRDTVANV